MTAKQIWWQFVLLALISYLAGNVNFALIISKFKKSDVRELGSGNPGTMNMSRNFGIKIGALTLFLDMLKGFFPVLAAWLLYRGRYFEGTLFEISDLARYIAGLAVVLGHVYPVFLRFHGGKGIATSIGVYAAIDPIFALSTLLAVFLYVWLTEYGSLGSMLGITALAVRELARLFAKYPGTGTVVPTGLLASANMLVLAICALSWWAHRANLARLVSGTEHRTSIRDMLHKKRAKKSAE